jgi:uncharacterized damage-inducible protein DinB
MMADEIARLVDQLQRSFEGPAWHGPAVLEALQGVSAEAAHAHPVAGAHSIWELALHLGGTYRLVLRRLRGDGAQLAPEEDWPAVPPPSAEAWSATVRALHELSLTQFAGVPQHDLYHAGQVAVLKRALAASRLV